MPCLPQPLQAKETLCDQSILCSGWPACSQGLIFVATPETLLAMAMQARKGLLRPQPALHEQARLQRAPLANCYVSLTLCCVPQGATSIHAVLWPQYAEECAARL